MRHAVKADCPSTSLAVPPCCRRGWVGPVTEALLMFYQDHELVKECELVIEAAAVLRRRRLRQRHHRPNWEIRRWFTLRCRRPALPQTPASRPPAGKYALPWDMTTSGHRQFNPLFMLQRGISFVSEATDTLRRRWVGRLSGRCCGAVGRWTGGQVVWDKVTAAAAPAQS